MQKKFLALLLSSLICGSSYAAGVSVGSTRLVYPSDKSQITVKLYNSDKKGNYLIQSWVSDEQGNKLNDYVVTPPLFVLKENMDSVLRVIYTGDKSKLPTDKEAIAYFNVKVIPSLTEEQQQIPNALLIATITKIKIFMRPANLMEGSTDAYKKITCSYENNKIRMNNPTPYYMNLVSLRTSVNGANISEAQTIPPQGSVSIDTSLKSNGLIFNVINDYGVQIQDQACHL